MTMPPDHAGATTGANVPIQDVILRVAQEMMQLANRLDELQHGLGPFIAEAAERDPDILHQMQGFDHMRQQAEGLALFSAALAEAAPCDFLVDPAEAARIVALADLAARLGFQDEQGYSCPTAWGDCEMF